MTELGETKGGARVSSGGSRTGWKDLLRTRLQKVPDPARAHGAWVYLVLSVLAGVLSGAGGGLVPGLLAGVGFAGVFLCASAAAVIAPPASTTARFSSKSPVQCVTRSHPAANAALTRSPSDPASACIEMSSLINNPPKPISLRMMSIIREETVAAAWSNSLYTICAVIAIGRSFSAANGAKSVCCNSFSDASTTGKLR